MLKKRFEGVRTMSEALCEAQRLLQEYIAPAIAGERMKVRIARAARHVGFTYTRTGTLWYGNARRIDPEEIDLLRAAAVRKAAPIKKMENDSQDFGALVIELKSQISELRSHIERLDRISRVGR